MSGAAAHEGAARETLGHVRGFIFLIMRLAHSFPPLVGRAPGWLERQCDVQTNKQTHACDGVTNSSLEPYFLPSS